MVTEASGVGSLVQRPAAGGYDRTFDQIDALGGTDHRRRLVDHTAGVVLEIGAETGRSLPLYRTASRGVATARLGPNSRRDECRHGPAA